MSRKDKPYLPLYVQDFLTDEKLMECSAEATGVYIRIMCVLHKSEPYGKLLLKQKDKQNESKIKNFAIRFAKHFPYSLDIILSSLVELVEEGCLEIEDDCIFQKRMVNDAGLSDLRSKSGSLGGRKAKVDDFALAKVKANSNNFAIAKHEANSKANADIDIDNNSTVYSNYSVNNNNIYNSRIGFFLNEVFEEKKEVDNKNYFEMIVVEMNKVWMKHKPNYSFMEEVDYPALLQIAYLIARRRNISKFSILNVSKSEIIISFEKITEFMASTDDKFLKKLSLSAISIPKNFQSIEENMRTFLQSDKAASIESKRILPEDYFTK